MRREAAEQKAALTQEINRARQFAGEALEHIPIAFCTIDREFRITYMNAAAAQLAAISGKQHMGACLWDLYPELIGSVVEANIRRAMEEQTAVEFEQFFPAPSNEMWYSTLNSSVENTPFIPGRRMGSSMQAAAVAWDSDSPRPSWRRK